MDQSLDLLLPRERLHRTTFAGAAPLFAHSQPQPPRIRRYFAAAQRMMYLVPMRAEWMAIAQVRAQWIYGPRAAVLTRHRHRPMTEGRTSATQSGVSPLGQLHHLASSNLRQYPARHRPIRRLPTIFYSIPHPAPLTRAGAGWNRRPHPLSAAMRRGSKTCGQLPHCLNSLEGHSQRGADTQRVIQRLQRPDPNHTVYL